MTRDLFKLALVHSIAFFLINPLIAQDPLFENSVVSNDIDFILETDPDAFLNLTFLGLEDHEMPDSQSEILFDEDTFVFEASFSTGEAIEIWCHSSFGSQEAAEEYADKLCPRLGKLPPIQRAMLDHVVIHNGDATAFAETEGNFFVLYSENMDDRISTNDLEETVFHESIHASIQEIYNDDPIWTNAQDADQAFVTEYAQSLPALEDMPESALFAYALITYPGRLEASIEEWLITNIPNRLEFFGMFYSPASSSIQMNEEGLTLIAYPNPTTGQLSIKYQDSQLNQPLSIFDSRGRLVKTEIASKGQNQIDIGNLPNGVYELKVPVGQGVRVIKK